MVLSRLPGRRGQRRISWLRIFFDKSKSSRMFLLQHRAIEPDAPMPRYDHPMSVVSQTGASYCPWCGKDLMKWYNDHLEELARDLAIPY